MTGKKKITFLYSKMRSGGTAIALLRLLKYINKDKYELNLILLEEGGELDNEIPSQINVSYCKKNNPLMLLKKMQIVKLVSWLYYRFREAIAKDEEKQCYYGIKLYSIPKSINADCVISYAESNFNLVCLAAYSCAYTKILWVHMDKYRKVNKNIYEKALRNIDHIFCVSNSALDTFVKQFPSVKSKISTVYNIIDENEIQNKAKEKTDFEMKRYALCTVGRISDEKGQIFIPETMKLLLDDGYDVYWYIVGGISNNKYFEKIKELITRYDLNERIIIAGNKNNPFPYIKNADIYIQPSLQEGYCTSTIEAKILKRPIIVSNISNMREQFSNGIDALLVNTNSVSLYESIKMLLDSPLLRKRFVEKLCVWSPNNEKQLQKIYTIIERNY